MQKTIVGLAGAALLVAAGCGRESAATREASINTAEMASRTAETASRKKQVIPLPIPGGDFFDAMPHHRAGIIHQFAPGPDIANGFDGLWAEPNEITNFNGTVAQVYMGGTATDSNGKTYRVDVDNRVYQGEYIGVDGRHGRGTFCEI